MSRRRRNSRETAFGFDSFMDVIANVIGIIIRFIIIAWVGARSYHSMMEESPPRPPQPADAPVIVMHRPKADWNPRIEKARRDSQQAAELAENAKKRAAALKQEKQQFQSKLAKIVSAYNQVQSHRTTVKAAIVQQQGAEKSLRDKLESAAAKVKSITEQVAALKKIQPKQNVLRYRTPISRPVTAEELHFECKAGRVTYVDLPAFLAEVRRGLFDKGEQLKTQWQVTSVTQSRGAFRARYTIERRASLLDTMVKSSAPATKDGFSFGMSRVLIEPITEKRGESASAATNDGSEFRRIIDSAFPQQTAVVFWVYPDSFPLYRQLRDYLYDQEFEVAARPLPMDVQIGVSRNGTASQAQ